MSKFDEKVDELDEGSLRDFHNKLVAKGCYEGYFNVGDIDEGNPDKLRWAIKTVISGIDYETLKEIGPDGIKREIADIESASTKKTPIRPSIASAIDSELEKANESKEGLIGELLYINEQKDGRGAVPPILRERYGEILTTLNEKHGMAFQDIEKESHITRKTVSKIIETYKKDHPIAKPDEGVLKGAEKRASDKLTKVVGATADQIIEDDMELAIHIRQTFLKEAYMRNMSLRQLVDAAIPMFFRTADIYTTVLSMEGENISLRTRVARLSTINKNLSYKLININGGYNG